MKAWRWKNVVDNLALSFCFLLESLIFAILLELDNYARGQFCCSMLLLNKASKFNTNLRNPSSGNLNFQ